MRRFALADAIGRLNATVFEPMLLNMRLTLRHWLGLLTVAALVPLSGLFLINARLNEEAAVSRVGSELRFAAALAAANQGRMVDSAHQLLVAIGNAPGLLNSKSADCLRYLSTLKERLVIYSGLGIVGTDGRIVCHARDDPNVPVGGTSLVQEALTQRRLRVSGYAPGRRTEKPVITFSMPVMNDQGQVIALALASMGLEALARPMRDAPLPPGSRWVILDRQGMVLAASSSNPNAVVGLQVPSPVLQAAVKTMRPGVAEGLDGQGRQRIYSFFPAGQADDAAFFVALSADRGGVLAPARQQLRLQLAALMLVALFGGWLAWRTGGSVITQAARRQANGQGPPTARHSGAIQDIPGQQVPDHLRLLETCIASLNDRVVITGPMTPSGPRIVFVNDAFERLTGYSREEVMGRTPGFLRGPATQPGEMQRISAALQSGQPVRGELINYTRSGQEFWLELDIVPVPDAQGTITNWVAVERDITQRKRAEQALIDSEQRYAALFESAPVPMWVYDLATARFLTVNRAAIQSYGYGAQEFLGMTLFDIRPESEHARLRQQLREGAPAHRKVWHHRRKDGSLFPVDVVSQPIPYAGRAARFVVALDMSAQVKAEEEALQHLLMLQRAADAAKAITWHQTLEGTMQEIADQARSVMRANQAVVSLIHAQGAVHALSLSEKYAADQSVRAPFDGTVLDALVFEAGRVLRLTQAELEAHPCWPGLDGYAGQHAPRRGWLAVPLSGRHGQSIGLLQLSDKYQGEFTQQDEYVAIELAHLASAAIENTRLLEEISQLNAGLEQKVAERTAELARQEALFRALAEQAPQAVWTASPEGAATYYNRAWFDLMGGELKNWSGYQWLGAVHPQDVADIKANWKTASSNLSSYSGTRRLLAKDGCFHTMTYRASAVLDDQGQVAFWVGIDADITEIKATEAALRLSNQELEAFSYSVSHDLRAPLNTVDGFSRLLAKQLAGPSSEKVLHYLSRIQAGVAQMGQLIEDLLSLSQLTRTQLRREPLDLTEKAGSILAECQARQPERQVAVSVQDGLRAEGDGRLVRVALENLLANAWKFTSQQACAEISIGQTSDAAGQPVFFVRDNGAGFDMAYADKLFAPFQRLHAASAFPGTGIGLAIVSRVIERHGGQLWAESAPGCGATFFFTLPGLRPLA